MDLYDSCFRKEENVNRYVHSVAKQVYELKEILNVPLHRIAVLFIDHKIKDTLIENYENSMKLKKALTSGQFALWRDKNKKSPITDIKFIGASEYAKHCPNPSDVKKRKSDGKLASQNSQRTLVLETARKFQGLEA